MDLPGLRYRNLATRCRHSAAVAPNLEDRAALLTMAIAYDRKASDVEEDWRSRANPVASVSTAANLMNFATHSRAT